MFHHPPPPPPYFHSTHTPRKIRHPNRPPCVAPSKTLYVRNLSEKKSPRVLASALRALFETYGPVADVRVRRSLRMRGQAFVVFRDQAHATAAHAEVQGFVLFAKPMFIEFSRAPSDATVAAEGGDLDEFRRRRIADRDFRRRRIADRDARERAFAATHLASAAAAAVAPAAAPLAVLPAEVPNHILFLQALPKDVAVAEIEAAFAPFDGLVEVRWVAVKPDVAFVEFASDAHAAFAKSALASTLSLRDGAPPVSISFANR
ncbi:hypothetical protein GGI15_001922 [Coemansia interrupta]|uniref:RRM domain-containing protein n=1 Tax=Coemansia interrupta TaxID=1126814 RepID=A0A9W8HP76_9FUNG|nr:hypothetical protein GGI15_001922 [Coemansia interrupta]